ncbi:hypothetical protein [Chryseobacterium indologenes]|uniref:Cytochrome C551 n=1 Tax=Chryseobacterium indologenes TaxID=253 RepID=A0A0N1KTZ0_CHRID|nr:hypothetical protein [Chryseobacterium indologenes]KPE52959.1 cytochrome C551 [Chryseobacterium indologenes]
MKKLLLAAIGSGILAVSCGTKESTMSPKNSDSAAVDRMKTVPPSTTDTMKTTTPDTIRKKMDSAATAPPAK